VLLREQLLLMLNRGESLLLCELLLLLLNGG